MRLQSWCQLMLLLTEAWLGLENPQGFGSLPYGHSMGLLTNWLPFSGVMRERERGRERNSLTWDPGSEIWSLLLYSIGHTDHLWYKMEGDHRQGSLESFLETGYYNTQYAQWWKERKKKKLLVFPPYTELSFFLICILLEEIESELRFLPPSNSRFPFMQQ